MAFSEMLLSTYPSTEELESLISEDETLQLNLANCPQPIDDLDILRSFAEHISGLYIELDTLDQYDLEPLYCFRNLQYLRIKLVSGEVDSQDLDAWYGWCANVSDSLDAVAVNIPIWHQEVFYLWLHGLVACRKSPLTLVLQSGKRKKRVKESTEFPADPLLQVVFKSRIELSREGMNSIDEKDKQTHIDPRKLQYTGPVDVVLDDDEEPWILDVNQISIDLNNVIVFEMSGIDDAGKFLCEGRAEWNCAENGFYFSARRPLDYQRYSKEANAGDYVSVKFFAPGFDSNGNCHLSGLWMQNGYEWRFRGLLARSI